MLNPKKIGLPAAFGFVLSFLISLVSTGNFGRSLLRGMIFAIVFGVLFFAIDFIYTKFLDDGKTVALDIDSKKSQTRSGSRIDITLSDDELSDDGQNLKFPVAQNRHGLNVEDKKEYRQSHQPAPAEVSEPKVQENAAPVQEKPSPLNAEFSAGQSANAAPSSPESPGTARSDENTFKPVQLGTPIDASGQEAVKPAAKKPVEKASEIDDLPEINDFVPDIGAISAGEPVIEDSEFAGSSSGGSHGGNSSMGGGQKATEHDVATLAKAIQTVLKKDE